MSIELVLKLFNHAQVYQVCYLTVAPSVLRSTGMPFGSGSTSISTPASVTTIDNSAFYQSNRLTSMVLSCASSVSIISDALTGSALRSISMPPGA